MPLRALDSIDMIRKSDDGVDLIISDHGDIPDPDERLDALNKKLDLYVHYLTSADYRAEFESWRNTRILVMAAIEPTEQMKNISGFAYGLEDSDEEYTVTVEFETITPTFGLPQ